VLLQIPGWVTSRGAFMFDQITTHVWKQYGHIRLMSSGFTKSDSGDPFTPSIPSRVRVGHLTPIGIVRYRNCFVCRSRTFRGMSRESQFAGRRGRLDMRSGSHDPVPDKLVEVS
jgi:hypothetical protein